MPVFSSQRQIVPSEDAEAMVPSTEVATDRMRQLCLPFKLLFSIKANARARRGGGGKRGGRREVVKRTGIYRRYVCSV